MILCLDVSTVSIGVAVMDRTTERVVKSAGFKSTHPKLEDRLWVMCEDLDELFLSSKPKPSYAVLEEGLFCRAHAGTFSLGAAQGAVMMLLTRYGIPIERLKVSHWKQVFCGAGNATKEQVMGTARAMNYAPRTFDEADAIGIAYGALAIIEDERNERAAKQQRKDQEKAARQAARDAQKAEKRRLAAEARDAKKRRVA